MNPAGCKRNGMVAWNELAPRYHSRWAGPQRGPFGCTGALLDATGVRPGDSVLDLACGTGAVARRAAEIVGPAGRVVAADTSAAALRIALECGAPANLAYVNADAESVPFAAEFDAVTCQFGIFFFPDAPAALRNARGMTAPGGRLGVAVHGPAERVPYYGCIMREALARIPDYLPPGAPALDRYSGEGALLEVAEGAGYSGARVRALAFRYSPGDFDAYWNGYLWYVAGAQRRRILGLGGRGLERFREAVRRRAAPYADADGTIDFPWEVLVLTARA